MEQKIKIAVIGLVGLLLVSFIVILGMGGAKQSLERQVGKLNDENFSLRKELEGNNIKGRQFEDKINSLNEELNRLTQEREDLQRKYESVDKVREALIEKINFLQAEAKKIEVQAPAQAPAPVVSKTEDAYWGEILKSKAELELQLASLRSEISNFKISSEQVQKEKTALEFEITSLGRDKQDLQRQVEYNQKIIDSISAELAREKNDKRQILETLKPIKNENTLFRRQIKSLNNRKASLEKKVAELQEKNQSLEARFSEVDVLLKDKMLQIDDVSQQMGSSQKVSNAPLEQKKTSVDLPPIVVHSQANDILVEEGIEEAASLGKILAVNRDNNFAVVDLGENQGIKIGEAFEVYRNDKTIATLETIQVRESISACDIKKESKAIKVGDTVKRQ